MAKSTSFQGMWSASASRRIRKRIIVEGELILLSPAHFGNGDTDELTDMPLLTDSVEPNRPLLTGASLAGALRSYLREREKGFLGQEDRDSLCTLLFGGVKGDDDGEQSPLIIEDSLGIAEGVEMRDGVQLDPRSRTAAENKLFNFQLWQAGTRFPLRFELAIREYDDERRLCMALATALTGLCDGSITLGARKRRGFGRIRAHQWRVREFDLTTQEGLLNWIQDGDAPLSTYPVQDDIAQALGVDNLLADQRCRFQMSAAFALNGSLLIRSGTGQDDQGPDMVHLHTRQAESNQMVPILSGTSLAGALRARAARIALTLGSHERAQPLINALFGAEMTDANIRPSASRLITRESVIKNARTDLVQNRVSIDRFTGGALETALFSEQPVFGDDESRLNIEIELIEPREYEIGLLLLLLKDLWTGDLPLGGEASVGRGRLRGKHACLSYQQNESQSEWIITAQGDSEVAISGDCQALEHFVQALLEYLSEGGGELCEQ